jgi:hypothetical protein
MCLQNLWTRGVPPRAISTPKTKLSNIITSQTLRGTVMMMFLELKIVPGTPSVQTP